MRGSVAFDPKSQREPHRHPPRAKARPRRTRGLGRVYERKGGTWWIQFSFRGRLGRESSGSKRESDAVKLLKRRHAEIDLQVFGFFE